MYSEICQCYCHLTGVVGGGGVRETNLMEKNTLFCYSSFPWLLCCSWTKGHYTKTCIDISDNLGINHWGEAEPFWDQSTVCCLTSGLFNVCQWEVLSRQLPYNRGLDCMDQKQMQVKRKAIKYETDSGPSRVLQLTWEWAWRGEGQLACEEQHQGTSEKCPSKSNMPQEWSRIS